MKSSKYIKLLTAGMLVVSPLVWTACSDAWDEHYNAAGEGASIEACPSLFEALKADADLSNFCKVMEQIGADKILTSRKKITLWAPSNSTFTNEMADSVIEVYNNAKVQALTEKGKVLDDDENPAYTQFLYNQMALYARSVSATTNDTIAMLNNKYMRLVGLDETSGTLENASFDGKEAVPFDGVVACNNGLLYKSKAKQTFLPNIYEALALTASLDSVYQFLSAFDEEELDEDASTPGDVVDGKQEYLDSVVYKYNNFLTRYGRINKEDSTYWMVVPTNEVWKEQYAQYQRYFKFYDPSFAVPKNSVFNYDVELAKTAYMEGRFFNMSKSQRDNQSREDSICNTVYNRLYSHYPRLNVFYKDDELLQSVTAGLDSVIECSNGKIFIDKKGRISPYKSLLSRMDIPANLSYYYEVEMDKNNKPTMTVINDVWKDTLENKNYNYMDASWGGKGASHTVITYKLYGTYSNVYYNVYVVTVPADRNPANLTESLPSWFTAKMTARNNRGASRPTALDNPNPLTAEGAVYPGSEESKAAFMNENSKSKAFVASGEKMDTILVAKAIPLYYCGASSDMDEPELKITFTSIGTDKVTILDKLYTRHLRFHRIILVPFNTQEEAEAAANNLDALNDELQREIWENTHGKTE